MKAIGFYQFLPVEDPASLVEVEVPTPEPGARDLLVRVKAVSVNPVDVKVRSRQKTVVTEPRIIGWDAAGVVESIGRDVSLFKAGDEVYYAGDITRPGCNSQFHLVDERIVGRKPPPGAGSTAPTTTPGSPPPPTPSPRCRTSSGSARST